MACCLSESLLFCPLDMLVMSWENYRVSDASCPGCDVVNLSFRLRNHVLLPISVVYTP